MTRTKGKADSTAPLSVVNARIAEFAGKPVLVRVSWDPSAPIAGTLVAVEPMGRTYWLHLRRENGRSRFVNTSAVLELAHAEDAELAHAEDAEV